MKPINIKPIQLELQKIKGWVEPIVDQKTCKFQADNLKAVKIKIKEINAKRTELVKPLNDTVKKINDIFKPILEEYEVLKDQMSTNILVYQRAEIERQQEAERKAREAEMERITKTAPPEKAEEMIEAIENRPTGVVNGVNSDWTKTRIKDNWVYEMVDPNKVPQKFCSPDHSKIMAAIRLGVREIPGMKIYNKGSVGSY